MRIKAIIFDMDGVLIEAKDWHYEALNRALLLFGYEISRFDHLTTYDGLPTRKKLEMLSAERNLPRSLHSFINEMKQIYTTEIIHQRCRPLFVHEYALSTLKAKGYKLGLASNSIRSTIELMMEKASLKQYLDVIRSNEDVTEGKPNPAIYTSAIEALNLMPEECLVVEDNENGIRAARAAGAHVLVVHEVTDVTLDRITNFIEHAEGKAVSL
ncbi:haloacid dehalogenase superfamily, subfamily IA, variant 3 with third motif having DD or ED/haloacid dehalogenase superfamily, subfamily IA, variant 1 with third motif having Dx(3-4)D or Dx(3-4)E [Cohaesibacter sp. ES.047]|uniref:HAD family hydrolase n=1 Tax=Cohaesibacter sp. ES.047 TaxID=1798205 RepID=UPI000BB8A2DC|nr:HAD family phosphatase [Cohaesibacter sp. ES.047]SNY91708.1 haloacid dehalogenase superfamily, subfamily IA, variant 3 with third motif having DD or ED/haloacid dehalogenase superfamily, subfamily IA, variant 1 with third motif having Dx(3-4)D or Dx(3-4)E [Cohaesibacter sp. ES.047]